VSADDPKSVDRVRRAFDDAFRRAPEPVVDTVAVVLVRVSGVALALRRASVDRIEADRPVTRLPGAHPALLGLAALRGSVLPVWSLASLLDLPVDAATGASRRAPRWLAVRRGVGFAFGELVGMREAPAGVRNHWDGPDGPIAVIDVGHLLGSVAERGRVGEPSGVNR
jgi:hypothetical protein